MAPPQRAAPTSRLTDESADPTKEGPGPDHFHPDPRARMRSVDHVPAPSKDPDVVYRVPGVEEDEVALAPRTRGDVNRGVVLLLGDAGDGPACVGVGPLGQAGEVRWEE